MSDQSEELHPPDISPGPLNFGTLLQGSCFTLQKLITNRTDQPVSWIADTGGASWLSLDRHSGVTQPHEVQTVYITANASSLAIGDYAGTVTFTPVVAGATPASTQLLVEMHVTFTPY